MRHQVLFVPALALLLAAAPAAAQQAHPSGCDMSWKEDGIGPFDYRNDRKLLRSVETRHFTPNVEQLKRGESTTHASRDISYTLGKFPNHHRALLSLVRHGEKLQADRDPLMPRPISCYFERAIAFRADDPLVRVIYAMHLHNMKRTDDAKLQLALATQSAADNALSHYNVGMVAFDLGFHDEALAAAHRALRMGLERPELRQRLERVGRWSEPVAAAASATVASAPAPAASAAASEASR